MTQPGASQPGASQPGATRADPAQPILNGPTGRLRSVRARVSLACAAVAVSIVIVLTVLVVVVLSNREYAALDRRLQVISHALAPNVAANFPGGLDDPLGSPRARGVLRALAPDLVATVGRDGTAIRTASAPGTPESAASELPVAPLGQYTVDVDGATYRVLTVAVDGVPDAMLSVGLPAEVAAAPVRAIRLWGIVIGALAAVAGAGLGWLVAGIAVRPLRQLRDRTRAVDGRGPMPTREELTAGASATETEQLADAVAGLLNRVELARNETERTLQNARDFAAAADHELRTPLTTIQTDLDVLLAHPDLEADQRQEILAEVAGAKTRMLDTLQALRALADGDVAAAGSGPYATTVDLADLARRAVESARSQSGDVALTLQLPDQDAMVVGSPAGLRLAIENLVSNALRHAHAHRVEVGVGPRNGWIVVWVDDDGVGLPAAEREQVFARFARGSQAVGSGSGLGLALAAQQADLHAGLARLTDSPWGGLRAELAIPAANPERHTLGPGPDVLLDASGPERSPEGPDAGASRLPDA